MKYDLSTEESRKKVILAEYSRLKKVMRFSEYVRLSDVNGDKLLKNRTKADTFLRLTHGWNIFTSKGKDHVVCFNIGGDREHIYFEVSKELADYIYNHDWSKEMRIWEQFEKESHMYFYCEDLKQRFWEAN